MHDVIVIVDDEPVVRSFLESFLASEGYQAVSFGQGPEALEYIRNNRVSLAIIDLRLPGMSGLEVLKELKEISPGAGALILTGYGSVKSVIEAMKLKADYFLEKPIEPELLSEMVKKTIDAYRVREQRDYLRTRVSRLEGFEDSQMPRLPREIFHAVRLLADNPDTTVLITGETGSGKSLVARMIHEMSARRESQLVDINCAGLGAELFESELFGHEPGAFTGANSRKKGLIEVAQGGTLFLDEIGEMPLTSQAKILGVIETRKFRVLGGTKSRRADVRIMAATNSDLREAVQNGKFREDLFFRINVMPIHIPPLRKRKDDIPYLAEYFLETFAGRANKKIQGFGKEAETILHYYPWPGNIRELRNVIERAAMVCEEGRVLPRHLPSSVVSGGTGDEKSNHEDMTLEAVEKSHIIKVLGMCKGNRTRASEMLGIHRSTLIKKIQRHGLD